MASAIKWDFQQHRATKKSVHSATGHSRLSSALEMNLKWKRNKQQKKKAKLRSITKNRVLNSFDKKKTSQEHNNFKVSNHDHL